MGSFLRSVADLSSVSLSGDAALLCCLGKSLSIYPSSIFVFLSCLSEFTTRALIQCLSGSSSFPVFFLSEHRFVGTVQVLGPQRYIAEKTL